MDLERNRFSAAIRRIMLYLSRLSLQSVRYNNDPLSLIQLRELLQFVLRNFQKPIRPRVFRGYSDLLTSRE